MAREQKVRVRIQAKDEASATVGKVESRFTRLGNSIKANALKITAVLATVAIAFRQIEKSAEQIGQKRALEKTLARQGIAINEFIGELKRLSDNQIATSEIVLASNRALKLGIEATDLPALLTVAANAAVDLGLTTTQAFNDIVTGIGRPSPLILDNLGIVTGGQKVYSDFAASIGKATDELTEQEKKAALVQKVLKGAGDATEDFSKRQDELTRSINRGKAAFDNIRSSIGQVGGGLIQILAAGAVYTTRAVLDLTEAVIKLNRGILAGIQMLPGLGDAFSGVAAKLNEIDDGLDGAQAKATALIADLLAGGAGAIKFGFGLDTAATGAENLATKLDAAGGAAKVASDFFNTATEAAIGLGNAIGEVTSAELELEILKINEALDESRDKLGQNSREYIRLRDIAEKQIELLQARIVNLRDGLGDLKDETSETAGGFSGLSDAMKESGRQADSLIDTTDELRNSYNRMRPSINLARQDLDNFSRSALSARNVQDPLIGGLSGRQYSYTIQSGGGQTISRRPRIITLPNGQMVWA